MTLLWMLLIWNSFIVSLEYKYVTTTTGTVKGKLNKDNDLKYFSFLGIPYAEKPIGELRFKAPLEKRPWFTILDATKEAPVCPQPTGSRYERRQMNEDCLFLNIYTPEKSFNLPVLVHVHGGELKKLSGNPDFIYGPQLLLRKEMVIVTTNYRLGALGFLSLDIEEAPGNTGIKDVLLCLKWIKANINRFGGDPEKITLSGNSAGAVIVHYLTLTKKSSGLFHQAILFSGSALGYRFLAQHPKQNAIDLGKYLGLNTTDERELLKHLKELNPFDIVESQEKMGENDLRNGYRPYAPFVPCIEVNTESAIITTNPKEIIKGGIPQNIPILLGFNSKEGIKMLPVVNKDPKLIDNLNNNFELLIPSNIEYPYGSEESENLAISIRQFYFNNSLITNDTIESFVQLVSDTQFYYSIDSWIKLHKSRSDSNTMYYYVFSYDGELNWFKHLSHTNYPGTAHSDELGYLFKTQETKDKLEHLDNSDKQTLNTMLTIVSNFVTYGNSTPNCAAVEFKWPECSSGREHVVIGDTIQIEHEAPFKHRLQFWYDAYDKYYEYLDEGGIIQEKYVP